MHDFMDLRAPGELIEALKTQSASLVVLPDGSCVYRIADEPATDVKAVADGDIMTSLLNQGRLRCRFIDRCSVWRLR